MEGKGRNHVYPPLLRRLTVDLQVILTPYRTCRSSVSLPGWCGFHFHRSKPLLSRRRAKLLLYAALSIADK